MLCCLVYSIPWYSLKKILMPPIFLCLSDSTRSTLSFKCPLFNVGFNCGMGLADSSSKKTQKRDIWIILSIAYDQRAEHHLNAAVRV
jgi:hypothetical protein